MPAQCTLEQKRAIVAGVIDGDFVYDSGDETSACTETCMVDAEHSSAAMVQFAVNLNADLNWILRIYARCGGACTV